MSCRKIHIISLLILISAAAAEGQPEDLQLIWHTTGADSNSNLGMYLTAVGDQNDDGYDDILVSNFGTRQVYLYYGGNPMDTIPDMVFCEPCIEKYGILPFECRDLNGDGYADFTIGADWTSGGDNCLVYVYFGGVLLDTQADLVLRPDDFVASAYYGKVMSMGDVNGDGDNDLAIGDPQYYVPYSGGHHGLLQIYYGDPVMDDIPDFTLTGNQTTTSEMGASISLRGDVNSDGINDILVAGDANNLFLFNGSCFLDSIPNWMVQPYYQYYTLSSPCYIIPDINNDGYDEIFAGTNYQMADARGIIYYGGTTISATPNVVLISDHGYITFNAPVGDINNDGYDDVIIGSSGRLDIFFLHPGMSAYNDEDEYILHTGFGYTLGYAGDINGDGCDEFICSTVGWPQIQYPQSPIPGEVYIYNYDNYPVSEADPPEKEINNFTSLEIYPNPFNSETTISFNLLNECEVKVNVYDILGQEIKALDLGAWKLGKNTAAWDGRNKGGKTVSSGVYLLTIQSGNKKEVRKMMLMR